ncbi:GT2 family glycosyltransferase/precorrin-6B methylase 2 [Clostridium beijerinckii]|uniref:glycosyltransferase n=1 Tax=Clostridium beijerinckii TaxID=1520 RepID=UPI00156F9DEE|nr:glycosyltransferase [Clostridium beijerinckii]NRT35108.1 GT2 family glycosyltransferase/precorrin-6B methylase 2 [Clostridium beijerinckii]NRT45462.1 GT2 family glycosyltransferase/precorrin-6B methylase 2 [Clostridium beijerinckii]NRZ20540.1 GT2 family glycosyltransferase/precorrin-6B methylase 2 [Clostridium beijerinckii]
MFEHRKTSIIILTYNNINYNRICIESIRKYTATGTYEIIIVDNNSTDGTREWLKEQNDIKLILNDENVGFPRGCNLGIEAAEKDNDILLLNNDTKMSPRWLDNLKICLYSDESIGAVGPITNNCSNYQGINVPYSTIDHMIEFASNNNISAPERWEQKPRLIAFCMLIKRTVIDKIGNLDERFTPGNFEDDDLCMRIIEAGYKLMVCNDSFIHHFGSTSFKKDFTNFNNALIINAQRFEGKWGFNSNNSSSIKFDIVGQINEPNDRELNILEFDCGLGATLFRLKYMYPNAQIYGIETNKNIAKICGKMIEIMTEDFEDIYTMKFKENKLNFFDYIIIGDRLQLSTDPWKLLKELKNFLKPGGYIIATISNLMHYSVIKELLNGNFIYNKNSILNVRNYNKFFTLTDIHAIFKESGYVNPYVFHYYTDISQEDNEFLNNLCSIIGNHMKEYFLSYEYVAKFQKDLNDKNSNI